MPSLTLITIVNEKDSDRGRRLLEHEAEKIKFLSPKTALIDDCGSYEQFNSDKLFHSHEWFNTDFALFIEFDSRIINPSAWTNEFFNYDYIGAPWTFRVMKPEYMKKCVDFKNRLVGNGGFSLRSRRLCELMASDYRNTLPSGENEDVFICQHLRDELESRGVRFAPYEAASKFAVENQVYRGQFGAHCGFVFNRKLYNMKRMSDDAIDKEVDGVIGRFKLSMAR